MSKSTLTRRALVASTAAIPVAALPLIAAQAATEPDHLAFALIERFKEASAIFGRAATAEEQAIDSFRDKFGELRPDALSKEVREGFAEKFPEVGLHKCRISNHEQIEKCRAKFGDEVVEALHDELRHQTKVYDETVEPLELAKDDALDRWNSALQALVQTPPETIEGLAAVLAFVSTDQAAVENLDDMEELLKTLAAHTARLARLS
jgi:hypothetical protein